MRVSERIPILDGWRGIAILFVLVGHLGGWKHFGGHGVTVFFVLSGYLITSRLVAAPINLRRFYTRRIFRLWPVAWLYLAFTLFLAVTFRKPIGPYVPAALLFFYNYLPIVHNFTAALTGHFWSLSIEEQFYLVWPAILLLTGGRALLFAVAGYVLDSLYLLVCWRGDAGLHTEYNVHSLLIGCALALAFQRVQPFFARSRWVFPIAVAGIITHVALGFPGELPTESACIALALASTVARPLAPLTWKPLTQLGLISYSVYVWQAPFVTVGPTRWEYIPVRVVLILGVALASFHWLERPGIRLGARLLNRRRI